MLAKTCLRYPGGKFYGRKKILPVVNTLHKEYREPFLGGASIFLAKQLSEYNWINDIDSELINFYQVISKSETRIMLYNLLHNEKANKKRHIEVKNMFVNSSVNKAFKFFYLNRTSFSGIMVNPRWGYLLGSSTPPNKWIEIIDRIAEKFEFIQITNLDFEKVISHNSEYKNHEVLLYVDPPYYKASKDIYVHQFNYDDHIRLAKVLKQTKFNFVLSYDNVSEIREIYDWAIIKNCTWKYFMSESRRLDGKELLITNFESSLT